MIRILLVVIAALVCTSCRACHREGEPTQSENADASSGTARPPSTPRGADGGRSSSDADGGRSSTDADGASATQICFATIRGLHEVAPNLRGGIVRRACAANFERPACRYAIRGIPNEPSADDARAVVLLCAATYCPHLDEPRPPMCSDEFDAGEWTHANWSREWVGLGGAALRRDHPEVSHVLWRTVAAMMAADWFSGNEAVDRSGATPAAADGGSTR